MQWQNGKNAYNIQSSKPQCDTEQKKHQKNKGGRRAEPDDSSVDAAGQSDGGGLQLHGGPARQQEQLHPHIQVRRLTLDNYIN